MGGLALPVLFLPGRPAYCVGGVHGENDKPGENESAAFLTRGEEAAVKAITAAGKEYTKLEKELASAPPAKKAELEERRSALGAKVASLAGRFKRSPAVQDAGAGFKMARGDFAGAGHLAEQGLKYTRPDGDPRLTARLLVTRGTSRWVAGDIPGACADGETGHKMDPESRGAFELMMYSCGRGPRVSGEAKAEKVSRLVAMKDQSIPHDAEEWARREDLNPTKAGGP